MLFPNFRDIIQAGEYELNLYKNDECVDSWPKQHWTLQRNDKEIIIVSDDHVGPLIDLKETDYTYILVATTPTLVVVATKEGKTFEMKYVFS